MMLPNSLLSKTLYQKRKFTLGWLIGLMAMTMLTLSFFPAFKNGALSQTFNNLSPALQKSFGSAESFRTVSGYISQQIFALRIPLLLTILCIAIFNSLTVGEERKGLLETQLSLPFSRSKILLDKLLAGIIIVVISSVGVFIGIWITLIFIHEHYGFLTIWQEILGAVLVSLDFGLVAFMLGSALGKRGLVIGLTSAFAFLSYLITSLVSIVPSLKGVEKASLFHYQSPTAISFAHVLVLIVFGIIVTVLAFILFRRRDIGT
jgi:ABC-2 type transport system permease protein